MFTNMRPAPPGPLRPIPLDDAASIGDFRRYPGCRLVLTCAMCGWQKPYDPERVIARLHELKSGGHATRLGDIARRVAWPCPGCHRLKWRGGLAWPAGLTAADSKRLAARYRN
ncbi:hypothetical protein [uncultured Phenylobacterium sp.]|uniref:hypothetical protein n=1 Tax=uncultured Phenylobacterium sp. TaxID=349273 RepID=UPI0025D51D35|nr:hypothetical protein [uncultured Phenylobacterium sp.]